MTYSFDELLIFFVWSLISDLIKEDFSPLKETNHEIETKKIHFHLLWMLILCNVSFVFNVDLKIPYARFISSV